MKLAVAAALVAAVAVASTAAAAPRATTVDLTLSCVSGTGAGTPTVQVQFISGYSDTPAWVGIVKTASGMLQLAQVGVKTPPIYSKARCKRTRTSVPLAPKGLPGPASALDVFLSCRVSSRVLVRIHASTEGSRVVTATAIVRTSKGIPVVWAKIGKNGKGSLLSSGRCMS